MTLATGPENDRCGAWDSLGESVRVMAQETSILLHIVYGAEIKKVKHAMLCECEFRWLLTRSCAPDLCAQQSHRRQVAGESSHTHTNCCFR